MISLALSKQDIIKLIALIAIALALSHLAEMRGLDLNFYPFVSLLIMAASVLIDAYFNSRRNQRELELATFEKAAPLVCLHHKITEQIALARLELNGLRSESESIKITNAIAQLDRESAVALLRKLSQPKRIDVWLDRGVSFLLGVAASILASYLYSIIQVGSNA